jgi:hypothetical protein
LPERRGDMRAVGRLGGGDVLVGDGSPVGNGGGGEVLEHRGVNRGVRRGQKEKENGSAVELIDGGEKRP